MRTYSSKYGFTLIELAMVITIVGLVIGGIWVGRDMIHQAELNSIIGDARKYTAALEQFRDKYRYLPGDFPDAESYWGTDTDSCGGALGCVPRKETKNGDGDGIIEMAGSATDAPEGFTVWQQLADAGFIPGVYNGVATQRVNPSGYGALVAGYNIPPTAIKSVVFNFPSVYAGAVLAGDGFFFPGVYYNSFAIVSELSSNEQYPDVPALRPEDAFNIDNKIDDGRPGTGTIRAYISINWGGGGGYPSCVTTGVAETAEYAITTTDLACVTIVKPYGS